MGRKVLTVVIPALFLAGVFCGNTQSSSSSSSSSAVKKDKRLAIVEATIGVADADQSTPPKLSDIAYPNKVAKVLEADHHHKVIFKFALTDATTSEKVRAHQTFVRFFNEASGSEIIFVAEPDPTAIYKFDLDVNSKAKEFDARSGKYGISLIVGDAAYSNPLWWDVADIHIKFQEDDKKPSPQVGGLKPEIEHVFREPETRPSATMSTFFTVLCLLPILFMLVRWAQIGVSIGFPFSLSALGFHLGLGGIFVLYYYFWLQLNMFTTMKYLIMIGIVTFLCGNSLLVRIAQKRKQSGS